MMNDQASAPAAPASAPSPAEQMTVCITAVGDGTYTVAEQDDPNDPNASTGDPSDQPQTAQDVDSALQMAKQLLTSGDPDDSGSQDQGDGNAPLAPADAQAAWKQMAAAKSKKPQGM